LVHFKGHTEVGKSELGFRSVDSSILLVDDLNAVFIFCPVLIFEGGVTLFKPFFLNALEQFEALSIDEASQGHEALFRWSTIFGPDHSIFEFIKFGL